jgi:hypothetical protein
LKSLRILAAFAALLISAGAAQAKGVPAVFNWGGETLVKIADLPDDENFQIDGTFVDLGVIYKEIQVLFMPIWQYEMRYTLTDAANPDSHYEMEDADIVQIAADGGVTLEPLADFSLGFWMVWGGKLVLLVFLGLGALYWRWRAKLAAEDAAQAS